MTKKPAQKSESKIVTGQAEMDDYLSEVLGYKFVTKRIAMDSDLQAEYRAAAKSKKTRK